MPDSARWDGVRIDGDGFVLRRWCAGDLDALLRHADDPMIVRGLSDRFPHPYTRADGEAFLAGRIVDLDAPVLAIEIDGEACGSIGVRHAAAGERAHSAELGYWLGVDYWGQGFGTEAARAVIDYYFEEFDLDQLIAGARVVNPSSRNILEKCGFQWSGVELHRFEALGSSSPVDAFRLSRGVWTSLKRWNSSKRRES